MFKIGQKVYCFHRSYLCYGVVEYTDRLLSEVRFGSNFGRECIYNGLLRITVVNCPEYLKQL